MFTIVFLIALCCLFVVATVLTEIEQLMVLTLSWKMKMKVLEIFVFGKEICLQKLVCK
jgi:hypothetical protein